MKYLSVCSGIEAATVAWKPLGWQAVAFAEIDKFPCAVLQHHYPHVPNWGDITNFQQWPNVLGASDDPTIDVLVGGTPCQSFSVAGLRAGLADPRGNLALTYLAVLDRYRPSWMVWENVPGVLSADEGGALGAFLGGLGQLGYGFAYRVLDAQYFGLAQRRARVFVVGHLGDWRRAAAVLFERESLSGHPAPRREAWERPTGTLSSRTSAGGELGTDFDAAGGCVPVLGERARALTASNQRIDAETETFIVTHSLRADGFDASEDGTGRGTPIVATTAPTIGQRMRGPIDSMFDGVLVAFSAKDHGADAGELAPTLRAAVMPAVAFDWQSGGDSRGLDPKDTAQLQRCQVPAVAFAENQRAEVVINDTAGSLKVGGGKPGQGYPAVQRGMQVRRLTPRECERLQGFPDDYTLISYRGKPAADGPRYKALGNSMAVPVMAWIGRRIQMVEDVCADLDRPA